MKKYILVIGLLACIFGILIGYHNHLLTNTVRNEVNSQKLISENDENNQELAQHVIDNEEKMTEDVDTKEEVKKEVAPESGESKQNNQNKNESEKIKEEEKQEVVASSYKDLSNEKCAWGFVRKSGGQKPDFYGPHVKVLDNNKGIYCSNKDEQVLYLTFDEGYENGYTASILDTLKEKGITATFFVTMPYVKQNQELVKRMINEGHIVGNHIPPRTMYPFLGKIMNG